MKRDAQIVLAWVGVAAIVGVILLLAAAFLAAYVEHHSIDSLFRSIGALAAAGALVFFVWHGLTGERRRFRKQSGLCPSCGYNLTGNISGICPECGTRVQ
ncbi:MAG TPA: hypothetical protein VFC78_17395 [Tepidisphaeraceae bacterium]|nr:hypothetical protein [Tepidisphaeraceae bacterium]